MTIHLKNCLFLDNKNRYLLVNTSKGQHILYLDHDGGIDIKLEILPCYELRSAANVGGDERLRIYVIKDGKSLVMSFPKLIMECKLGRLLKPNETADHIDEDKTNNRLSNLQVLSLRENALKNIRVRGVIRSVASFKCFICGTQFIKYMNHVRGNWKKCKEGPFCSRRCAGIWSSRFKPKTYNYIKGQSIHPKKAELLTPYLGKNIPYLRISKETGLDRATIRKYLKSLN